jgi:hypothetical protein
MDNTGNETLLNNQCLQEGDISYLRNFEDSEAVIKNSTNKKKK